ncbi:MAG: hypothetical protein H6707_18195 [Deltaproteobacteria bacterium]|nr:hypothetical protein [Deltaproteobacteria bacterium]
MYRIILGASCILGLVACSSPNLDSRSSAQGTAVDLAVCDETFNPAVPSKAVVVNDPAVLQSGFELQKTLQALIDSRPAGAGATTPEALLTALLSSTGAESFSHPANDLTIDVTPVRPESNLQNHPIAGYLNPQNSAQFMRPVALFNRYDLADDAATHCGEYRIVYANAELYFLIFEAVLPNPTPGDPEGCRPIASLWGELPSKDPIDINADLQGLYYSGLGGSSPVVHFNNYGFPLGQIRSNSFVDFQLWELREYRTGLDLTTSPATPTILVDTVKGNPLVELFLDSPWSVAGEVGAFNILRDSFRSDFIDVQLAQLIAPETAGLGSAAEMINGIGAAFGNLFNDMRSVSQGTSDDPARIISTTQIEPIEQDLDDFFASNGAPTLGGDSTQRLLNRAGAMTCGGCHRFSAGRPIGLDADGATVTWPNDNGFTHVSSNGGLSAALKNAFLPARHENLKSFACTQPVGCEAACGDINKDGQVNAADVALLEQHLAGQTTLVDCQFRLANVTPNFHLTSADLTVLSNAVSAGTTASLSCSEPCANTTTFTCGDVNESGTVTTLDMVNIRKHILGIEPLSFCGAIAADVNGSGTVTTFDLVNIRKRILGISSEPFKCAFHAKKSPIAAFDQAVAEVDAARQQLSKPSSKTSLSDLQRAVDLARSNAPVRRHH